MSPRALLLCVLAAAAVSVFFWDSLPIYPFRLLVTLMHESCHAITAKLLGGTVHSVTISPTEGGLTQSSYPASLWRGMMVTSAGYVGSAVAGATLLALAGRMRTGRVLLFALVAWELIVAIVWVPVWPPSVTGASAHISGYSQTDGPFTLAFILSTSLVLGLVAWFGPTWLRRWLIVFIATLSCLAAIQDVRRLFGYGLTGSASDADGMRRLTHVPAAIWAGLWLLMALAATFVGLRSMLRARRRAAPRAVPRAA